MSFQFLCPQGHLLEGEPSQAGQQCQCPTCGMMFIIPPAPHAAPQQQTPWDAAPQQSPFGAAGQSSPFAGQPDPFAAQASPFAGPEFAAMGDGAQPAENPLATQEPRLFHISCPNGHELETPEEMLDQDVLCPQCQVQFQLREKDSVEYKERMQRDRERREEKSAKAWLNWAVAIAVIVLIGLGVMIAMSSG